MSRPIRFDVLLTTAMYEEKNVCIARVGSREGRTLYVYES